MAAAKGNKNAEKWVDLPFDWQNHVLEWYSQGASDTEVMYLMNRDLCKMSRYMFLKMYNHSESFRDTINEGRQLMHKHIKSGGNYISSSERTRGRRERSKGYRKPSKSAGKKLSDSITVSINYHIKTRNKGGNSKCFAMLGFSKKQFLDHFESLFEDGMNWSNRVSWHIDHIIPKCKFDLDTMQGVIDCWQLSNMRPVWSFHNIAKGDKIELC